MDIRVIRREGNSYVAYENQERVRVFDGSFEAIIVGGGRDFGGVYFDPAKAMPSCWSQTLKVPGPPIGAKEPVSKTCIEVHEKTREPVLQDGKRVPLCPNYMKSCIPAMGLAIMVPELGVHLWNFVLVGDEFSGESDFDNSLYSFKGFYQKLLHAAGKLDDLAKYKIQFTFSAEQKRTFIKVPVDTDLHSDPEQAQRQYDAITKIWSELVRKNQHFVLTSIDPRLWATPKNPLVKEKAKSGKKKAAKKPTKRGNSKEAMKEMQLKRKDLKPETRARIEKELAEIRAEKM